MSERPVSEAQAGSLDDFIRETVQRYRTKILDLSSRNPLIQFRHSERSRSHIRIVNEIPEILFDKLEAGRQLTFAPVPDPVLFPSDEDRPEFQAALQQAKREDQEYRDALALLGPGASDRQKRRIERELRDKLRPQLELPPFEPTKDARKRAAEVGISIDYDLPRYQGQSDRHFTDLKMQTLFFPDELGRKLAALRDAARVLVNDAGINALYCAFGFLEYYETGTSEEKRLAPLAFYPIELDRQLVSGEYRYFIRPTNDEVQVNVALAELLRQELSLELPGWIEPQEGVNALEQYFAAIERTISARPDWKLHRYVTIGLFTFSTLAMYKDLDPQRWAATAPIESHPIVRMLVAGAEVHGSRFAEDYDLDQLHEPDVLLVTDADSSQHSAVIDVLKGKNCVIQGPPGTGKSQTITNIISAALHEGKTVLFVAEKMAALEVVEKRLNAAGLEQFCFEVHSTKTSKTAVTSSLASRLAYRGPRLPHLQLESNLAELDRTRKALIYYVQKTREAAGKTGLSVYEVLLGSAKREHDREELPAPLATARIPASLDITEHRRRDMLAAAATLEGEVQPLLAFGSLSGHPWRGLRNSEIADFENEELLRRLQRWTRALEDVKAIVDAIAARTHSTLPAKIADLAKLCTSIAGLGEVPADAVERLFQSLALQANRTRMVRSISALEEIIDCERKLANFSANPTSMVTEGSRCLAGAFGILCDLGLKELTIGKLEECLSAWRSCCRDIEQAKIATAGLTEAIGLSGDLVGNVRTISLGVELLQQLPRGNWFMRTPTILDERYAATLRERADRCNSLKKRRSALESRVELAALPSPDELRQYAFALRAANPITALFRTDCRKARRLFRLASKNPLRKLRRLELAEELLTWAQYLKDESDFIADRDTHHVCGAFFKGLETPFLALVDVSSWARTVRAAVAGHGATGVKVRDALFSASIDQLNEIAGRAKSDSYSALKRVLAVVPTSDDLTLVEVEKREAERTNLLGQALSFLTSTSVRRDVNVSDLPAALGLIDTITSQCHVIEQDEALRELLPVSPSEAKDRVGSLKSTWSYGERIANSGLPAELKEWLFGGVDRLPTLQECARELASKLEAQRAAGTAFADIGKIDTELWCSCASLDEAPLGTLLTNCEHAYSNAPALKDYVDFLIGEEAAREKGLSPILDAYVEANQDYRQLAKATELVFYRSAAEEILNADPKLKRHSGATHEQLRKQYQQLDREYIGLRRKLLANELASRLIPDGNAVGRVSDLTELALLERVAGQTRPRTPLRELFRRAGRAVQALKPCWMMSPMSVAQFLEPGAVKFDLVIMDEASQIRPEEALGAILRSNQLVVVGDQMQLPPTPFFQKLSIDGSGEMDEEETEDVKQESVLEAAAARFHPPRRLNWHYRSEHGSLISFSNREFYQDKLTVFPSPYHDHPEYGVKLMAVGGTYAGGLNPAEGKAVVQAATSFMELHPNRSLGIVAVNSKQAELIREEMDKVFAANPRAEAYRAKWEEGLESFFVKNLENVQGDERDVIFISTVYGPDEQGNMYQRFGPINSEYGHRRLNVLFTRAKKKVVVFTSMKPEDIQEEGKHWGVRVLKGYLRYARDGHGILPEALAEHPENEFEQWVLDILRTHGFDAVPQLGFVGYRIDIAVRNPKHPGTFICGIECDGASYHRARSVRERDRLRQEVLERLGWNIYRIWSTDWFRNPSLQTRKLIDHLKALSDARVS